MCKRTCRDLFPMEPETWCEGCTEAEADDREANMVRYRVSEAARQIAAFMRQEDMRRECKDRWEARFANTPEIVP